MTTHDQYREDLALLAAGALSSAEAAELEQHLENCESCKQELSALTDAFAQIGIAQGMVPPPEHLRVRILAQAVPTRIVRPTKEKSVWPVWFWAPAFAAILLAVVAFTSWRQVKGLEARNRELTAQLRDSEATLQQNRALFKTLTTPDALHFTLTASGKSAPPQVKTIYSPQQHSLILTASSLPPLPEHKAYELWLIPDDGGAPVAYGTFKPDAHGNAVLVLIELAPRAPKAFAVTVEGEKGSPVPTSPVILVGSAS